MKENNAANDKATGLFHMTGAIGCILAPVLGGFLTDIYRFQTTCDIFAVASLSFAVIYFFCNIWPGFLLIVPVDP